MSENTHGIYENIHDIYSETQKSLNEVIQSLINCGDDLKEAYQKKQMRKELLTKKMQDMRTKMMDSINKYIDNIEKQILLGIQNIQSTLEEDFANVDERIGSLSEDVKK